MTIKYFILTSFIAGFLLLFLPASFAQAQEELISPQASFEPTPEPVNGPPEPTPASEASVIVEESPAPSPTPEVSPVSEATPEEQPVETPSPPTESPQPTTQVDHPSPMPTATPAPQNGFSLFSWKGFFNLDSFFDQFWGTRFQASMDGSQIVGKTGDADGAGKVMLETYPGSGKMCIVLKTTNLDHLQGAAIHWGPFGVDDQLMIKFPMIISDGVGSGCVQVDSELLKDIRKNPFNYYMNITTSSYPDGAIRGQLSRQ